MPDKSWWWEVRGKGEGDTEIVLLAAFPENDNAAKAHRQALHMKGVEEMAGATEVTVARVFREAPR